MRSPRVRFQKILLEERDCLWQRLRTSALTATLIAILLYVTQWIALRPGLAVLLFGHAGVAIASLVRLSSLEKDVAIDSWFEQQQTFVRWAALSESICQALGFALLGYEIWFTSGSVLLALAIAIVYPAVQYFAITRRNTRNTIRRLKAARETLRD